MYYKCESCSEAYFLTEEARSRHNAICVAVNHFASRPMQTTPTTTSRAMQTTPTTTSRPMQTTPTTTSEEPSLPLGHVLDLTIRKRRKESTRGRGMPRRRFTGLLNSTSTVTSNAPEGTTSTLPRAGCRSIDTLGTSASSSRSTATFTSESTSTRPSHLQWELKKGLKSARDYIIRNPGQYLDNRPFIDAALPVVLEILDDELQVAVSMRYSMLLETIYVHPDGSRALLNFKSLSRILYAADTEESLTAKINKDYNKILTEEADYQQKGSGWSIESPATLTLRVSRFMYRKPTGSKFIELAQTIRNRKATVSVRNRDEECFKYSLLTKHIPDLTVSTLLTEHSFKDLKEIYNFDGLEFPVSPCQIKRFEKQNVNTSINVFECGPDGVITPYRVISQERQDHTDLLLYTNKDGESHYVYILDFAKLIKPQLTKGRNNITVCKRCYSFIQTRRCMPNPEVWLQEHLNFCLKHKPTPIRLPEEGRNLLKFKQFETQIPVPIIVVADFESTLNPAARTDNAYQEHVPNSFCTLIKSTLPDELLHEVGLSTSPYLYRAEDAGQEFMRHMHDLAQCVEKLYTRNVPLGAMSAEETEYHTRANVCDLCQQSFNDTNVLKSLDHCHITGKYRHTLCDLCNLRARLPNFIPVYFHNLTNYDQCFIVRNLEVLQGCRVHVIPANNEKFISISVKIDQMWIRFLDSYRLMAASLAELAGNLTESQLIESSKLVPVDSIDLIRGKGVYCYDYIKDQSVFEETSLPPEEAFYNTLNDEPVDPEDYKHAKTVWYRLNMQTFGDYHDFYLRLDVCLLMDILIAFRKTCMKAYNLDCSHHYTAPGLAFRAMLRITGVTLELLTDSEQLLMIESAMRGGLVQCNVRYAKANNQTLECPADYDPEKDTTHLMYLDCTNLYGHAMSMPLPSGNFKWVDTEKLNWSNLSVDSPHGLIMECDVEYPDAVHDRLQELPPLPEQSVPPGGKTKKLLATLQDKTRYVAHYTVFQQAVRLGLKVTKVYRALSFSQSRWMKSFISMNADLRAQSTVAFDKQYFKLMNNSVFGKSMESLRNRVDIRVCTTDEAYQKLIRSPRYEEHTIISENVITVRMRRKSVVMDKPIYLGMVILDLSKVHMYEFYYNVLCKHFYSSEIELNYTDTDSYLMTLKTERDVYAILKEPTLSCHLDGSVFPADHPLRCDENKGRIGTFKDETKGRPIVEYVGLRPKMYAYRFSTIGEESSQLKAKGIKSAYVNKNLRFQHYKDTLFNIDPNTRPEKAQFNLIRSKKFNLYSTSVTKKSLSSEDNKRHILDCGIRTLPYGHYKLRNTAVEDSPGSAGSGSD